jgi:pimeloyl-ACP methyl ester carboxylesterase
VEALGLDKIIAVGHDAGGPTAVKFALKYSNRTAAVAPEYGEYGVTVEPPTA